MTIRKILMLGAMCAAMSQFAYASPVNYSVNFQVTSQHTDTIGAGSFSYDSLGQSNTVVSPVTLPDFTVVINGNSYGQTSPLDDSLSLDLNGFVNGLTLDISPLPNNEFLQLNSNGTFFFSAETVTAFTTQAAVFTSGTYTITTSGVPEPASFGLVSIFLAAGFLLRSRSGNRTNAR